MCGIVGVVNWGDRSVLEQMNLVQQHRGPDDSGEEHFTTRSGAYAGLGSARLSIIDLSPAGHMPMCSDDRTLWIAYNGEIYNFKELRDELSAKGHRFRSRTDTEVVLRLYEEMGPECVNRLRGMFAFAIWDTRRERLFLARDHFGIKPLYYIQRGNGFAFASEIKSLARIPDLPRELDLESLHSYLTFLWVPDPKTAFKDIFKLEAGHYALFEDGKLTIKRFWDLGFPPADHHFRMTENELIEELRKMFRDSVRRQLVSDVPLGSFLSAGIDSNGIVAMASEIKKEPLSTYTIAFHPRHSKGEVVFDDAAVAARAAGYFGTNHTEIVVDPDVQDLLPKIVWHMDEPVADPAAIMAYLLCKEARSATTVLLSGIGGDELFAGYRKHRFHRQQQLYQRLPGALRQRIIEPFLRNLPSMYGTPLKGYVYLARKFAASGSLPPQLAFIRNATYLDDNEKRDLYTDRVREAIGDFDPKKRHLEMFDQVHDADFLNRMLYLDTKVFMVSLNLTYNDKMSMASSVEVRVPFLDVELAEFAAREIPPELKLHGKTTKYIFRKAMEGLLPEEVFRQPKAGFGAPIDPWTRNELRPMIEELLSEKRLKSRGLFRPRAVRQMLDRHYGNRIDRSLQIWQLITLELWMQTFLDRSFG